MIRYCISALLLVACSGIGTKEQTIAPDPLPLIVLPEIEIRAYPILEASPKFKPIRRAAVHRRAPCVDANENTKEEFLAKLECVKKLTEEGGA